MHKLYDILNKILSESLHSEAQFTTKYTLEKLKQLIINPDTNEPYTEDEFKNIHKEAYRSAKRQNLLNTLFPILTPEEVKKIALDPKTGKKRFCHSKEFKEKEPEAYNSAKKLGILTDLYFDAKQYKDWTPEELKQGAIDCKTGKVYISRNTFANGNKRAYEAARYHGVLDQLISFKGEYNKAFIYVFKFSDKQNNPTSAYIGLSTDPELRKKEHITGINRRNRPQLTAVTEYIKNHPEEKYEFEVLTKEPLDASGKTKEEQYNSPAGKAEREQAEYFKNKGYKIINKKEGGKDFGNTPVESEEELLNQALKYKSWTDLVRAGMPPQYPNPNNWKSGLYQKIRRKDKTNPGFTKKVKQAIGTKRLQELAGITEIKIRPKGMGSKYIMIQRDSDQGDFVYFDDDEIEKYLKSVIDPEYIDEVDYFMNDEDIGWDVSSFSYLSKDDDDDGNFEISNFLKVTDKEIEDYAKQEMSYYLFSRPDEFPYKD